MVAEKLDSLLSGLAYLDALSRQGVARIARCTHRIPVERGQAIVREIDRSPGFAQRIIVGLSRRLEKDAKDARASALSGVQRLADMLLEEAGEREREREAKPILTLPASKLAIASRLDLTPEHLSRILRKLSQRGLIRVDGPRVTILNLDGLRDIIGPMHAREGADQDAVTLGERPC